MPCLIGHLKISPESIAPKNIELPQQIEDMKKALHAGLLF
jgi:hypothetical protein